MGNCPSFVFLTQMKAVSAPAQQLRILRITFPLGGHYNRNLISLQRRNPE
jgi:hypothetical protein